MNGERPVPGVGPAPQRLGDGGPDMSPTAENVTAGVGGMRLRGLNVRTVRDHARIVRDAGLTAMEGEIVGVVGESGSGKTTLAHALLGYARPGTEITSGKLHLRGEAVDLSDWSAASGLRGRVMAYIPQDASQALNPAIRIKSAVGEMASVHGADATEARIRDLFEEVGLPITDEFVRRFPHQISGGQQHRVSIAVGLACRPPIVVLDEPTTGLDVITQARLVAQLLAIRAELNVTMIYISHDLSVVAEIADRVNVMYAGRIVESAATPTLLSAPQHPYTRGLLASVPDHRSRRPVQAMPGIAPGVGELEGGCSFAPRCACCTDDCTTAVPELVAKGQTLVRCVHPGGQAPRGKARALAADRPGAAADAIVRVTGLWAEYRSPVGRATAVADVSFTVRRGSCLALVGESGSGKTTTARVMAGLHPTAGGSVEFDGAQLSDRRTRSQRRLIQIVLQSPFEALNPRLTVESSLARPGRLLRGLGAAQAREEAKSKLAMVRLPARVAGRYPSELSGGERQRVSIARALMAEPLLMVCDEVTSALDVSVQAAVLELLADLREELGLSLLFITHDLGVVSEVAEEVAIMRQGRICEAGAVKTVLAHPTNEYTLALLDAAPKVKGS